MNKNGLVIMLSLFTLCACTVQQEDIDYGNETCSFCRMNIVDPRYAAEIVTVKGKVFKFDAVECMINYNDRSHIDPGQDLAFVLVNSYTDPGNLHDAHKAYYVRSKAMPSPMGMFITPFQEEDSAKHYVEKHGGKIFMWLELNDQFHRLSNLSE